MINAKAKVTQNRGIFNTLKNNCDQAFLQKLLMTFS